MTMRTAEPKLYTIAQAAEILGDDVATVRELVRLGKLPHQLVGREMMITGEALFVYITD